jgi:roadblock/LC7 domain-containing protein
MATISKLKELMSIPGAVAAGIFSDDGRLIAYYGNIDEKSAEIAAMMCAANKLMFNMQAKGWSAYTGQGGFYPVYGFAVAGGKYAACIMGNVGVFVELDKADFDKTFEVLSKYL